MRSRVTRSRLIAGAAAGLAAAGLLAWAVYPAQPIAARPAADRGAQSTPTPVPSGPALPSPPGTQPVPRVTPPGTAAPSPTPLPPPARTAQPTAGPFTAGLRIGAFTGGQSLASFDAKVGQAVLTVSYVRWGTPVRWLAHVVAAAAAARAEPVLELYPGPLGHNARQIAAGAGGSEGWLASFGRTIAQTGDPVTISFFPEMNGPWRQWWSQGPANYIRAFRHVHAVLSARAGPLITWFWQPSAMHNANPDPMPWWPGSGYADIVALDGYYYFPHDTFDAIFGATIKLVRRAAPAVPMMVGETAAGPMYGRQAWEVGNLFAGIRGHRLLGLVWFNRDQHYQPYQFHQDWRLQDHPGALAAFRACLRRYGPLARLLS